MKRWQFWVGLLISLIFLYIALSGVQLSKVWNSIQSANYIWLLPGVLVYFLAVVLRSWRWNILLQPIKDIHFNVLLPIVSIGYMGNNIFPARAGEILRTIILKREENISISASLASIAVERIFDGMIMLAFVFINLPEFTQLAIDYNFADQIKTIAYWGSIIFMGLFLTFILATIFTKTTENIFSFLINRVIPERWRKGATQISQRFLTGLQSLRSPKKIMSVLILSVAIWLLETVFYWFVLHAFPFQVSFSSLMLMNGTLNLITTIPSAPGYLGTFDAPGIAYLKAIGVQAEAAAGYTLVLHAALWLPVTLLGAYFFTRKGLSWSQTTFRE
jgi:uncharacterized protein (TIRG00374 family)